MFEHLSDPSPPALGSSFQQRVVARARARQHRTRVAIGGLALVPFIAAGGFALHLRNQANELDRIDVEGLVPAKALPPVTPPNADEDVPGPIEEPPPLATPLNILVVGVDRRPAGDEVTGSRADTIVVVRIDPINDRIHLLSVPRDTWIESDSHSGARINSFTADQQLVEVASEFLGIGINHYVEVDFDGFRSLIDLAGGIEVPFDRFVRDTQAGFAADPGCNVLSGDEALAYVRSRKLESLDPDTGEWTTDPRADFGRIERQQDLIHRALGRVLTADYGTTDEVRLLTDVVDDLTVDTGLDLDGLRAIFGAARSIGPERVVGYDLTHAVHQRTINRMSVLMPDPAAVRDVVESFLTDTSPTDAGTPTVEHADAIRPSTETTC